MGCEKAPKIFQFGEGEEISVHLLRLKVKRLKACL